MSFMHTDAQIIAGTKTVTRRLGWWFLKGGEEVRTVEKSRGFRPGEKIHQLRLLRIVESKGERLDRMILEPAYGRIECALEGYPDWSPLQFVEMFCDTHERCTPSTTVNQIAFTDLLAAWSTFFQAGTLFNCKK